MSSKVTDISTQLNDVTEELLTHWLKRMRQLPNQEAAFKEYSQMVGSKLSELSCHLSRSKTPQQILSSRIALLTVTSTLLGSLFASKGVLGSLGSEVACDLGRPILKTLHGIMRHVRGTSTSPSLLTWLVKAGTILMKFTLRTANTDSGNHSRVENLGGESDSSDEPTAMDTSVSMEPVAKEQWRDVLHPVLQEIGSFFGSSGKKSYQVIGACLMYMQTSCILIGRCCDVGTIGMATSEMWQALLSLMGTSDHWNDSMMNDFKSTLSRITETMDLVQFKTLLSNLLQDTLPKREGDTNARLHLHLHGAVVAWQLLPGCCASEENQGALRDVVPQAMLNLLEVLKVAVRDWSLGGAVALSVLEAVSSIIGQGKSLVSSDEAMYAQHFCLMIPVAKVTTAEFPLVFSTMCQILRSLLIGYPRTVMNSLASYFACLQYLLKAVMHRGQQRTGSADGLSDHDLYMCAENMERLLTMLATYKSDVNKLAVFLVSDYIAELQKGTLLPLFKKTLVTGVYNLLDVCDERALDYLNANLPHNLREIFKTFYSDFQKYYRYAGKV